VERARHVPRREGLVEGIGLTPSPFGVDGDDTP
jgi:hypothetical protein